MDPNSISCSDVDQNLWRYIDRELSASALASISSHLRACETCQGLYHERSRDASHYRMVFVDSPFGEPFVVKLKRRLRQEAPASGGGASGRRSRVGFLSLRHRKVRRALAVAAMLILIPVVILIGLLQKSSERRWLGSFQARGTGKVYLISEDGTRDGGVSLPLQARGGYGPGDGIDVPKGVEVSLDYGQSKIKLEGPAFLRVEANSTRDEFLAYLEKGKLGAEVTPLTEPHQAFVVRTEHAVATVVGTRFTVEALEEETLLEVQEGTVKFQWARARPGAYEKVEAGQSFRMGKEPPVLDEVAGEAGIEAEDPVSAPGHTPARVGASSASGGPGADPAVPEAPSTVTPSTVTPSTVTPSTVAPAAVESPPEGPAKSGDGTPNSDLDQPVTR